MSPDLTDLTPELVHMATSYFSTLLLLAVGVVLFVFLIQRPLKKQQQAQRELQSSLIEGGRVMLTSGLFGTLRHLGDKQAVVELAPGLEVTVLRQAISRAVAPDDEEFEYTDEAGEYEEAEAPADADESPSPVWSDVSDTAAAQPAAPHSEQAPTGADDPDRPSSI
ncbi:MAG: preprotein translocase subunit YajC [Propionibacterium sp.]|nr:preprotein translocase subunit YajC [Propionibacterium sp.]